MSTTPPNMPPNTPPGGNVPPPYPPYDPKTQWRIYREQQKAAWRAQRDAWKAQRHAMKASYVGAYGPRVPSIVGPIILIVVGVIALLMITGRINSGQFWMWYGQWWPLLLIVAGLALLAEWAIDLRRETPVRRGGSFIGILIFLAVLGLCAAGWNHAQPWFHQWNNDGDEFFNTFGLPEHDMEQQELTQQIPANAAIQIENPRGNVSITAGEGSTITVQAHELAYASSDSEAKKVFDAVAARLTVSGSSVLLKSESNSSGMVNMTVTVPRTAKVTVNNNRGDVSASGLGAGITVTARGDVQLNSIAGSVEAHFPHGHHDFSAHDIQGDVTVDGDLSNITISEIKGKVSQSGEILFGDAHIENVSGQVHLHTSRTDVEVAELPGDLTLDPNDLRVNQAKGQVRVVTHSKDIDLNQIYGDSYVKTSNGHIVIEPAGVYAVDANNEKGDIEVSLPPNASATVNARSHNGEIVSDYPIPATEGENKQATFTIGSGTARIVLNASNGDVHIKKGPGFPATPTPVTPKVPMLNVPPYHRIPPGFEGKQLKEPKVPPAPPVKQ
ncbi:MAG TPA: DUF4097 family beta strand repeat-containing protein [Terracidiphilus sp.]|nr:DUF4097 family beta strand repeat-containing protein [Terracidiphilus sp.]